MNSPTPEKNEREQEKPSRRINENLLYLILGSIGGITLILIDTFIYDFPSFFEILDRWR